MPSPLVKFSQSAFLQSRAVIGGESFSISGGDTLSVVLNETADVREYDDPGFDRSTTLDAVIRDDEFRAAYPNALNSYIGKIATARGMSFRVMGTSTRPGFTILQLSDARKGR